MPVIVYHHLHRTLYHQHLHSSCLPAMILSYKLHATAYLGFIVICIGDSIPYAAMVNITQEFVNHNDPSTLMFQVIFYLPTNSIYEKGFHVECWGPLVIYTFWFPCVMSQHVTAIQSYTREFGGMLVRWSLGSWRVRILTANTPNALQNR